MPGLNPLVTSKFIQSLDTVQRVLLIISKMYIEYKLLAAILRHVVAQKYESIKACMAIITVDLGTSATGSSGFYFIIKFAVSVFQLDR